jgi:hypothetical protein
MAKAKTLDVNLYGIAVTLAVASACFSAFALSRLSHPADYKESTASIAAKLDRADKLLKAPGDAFAYPVATLCSDQVAATDALKKGVETGAAASSVALTSLLVNASSSVSPGAELSPIEVRFEATGQYEALLQLLNSLSKTQPEVFVESLDLKPQTSTVSMKFSGRAFCWTSAPQ